MMSITIIAIVTLTFDNLERLRSIIAIIQYYYNSIHQEKKIQPAFEMP